MVNSCLSACLADGRNLPADAAYFLGICIAAVYFASIHLLAAACRAAAAAAAVLMGNAKKRSLTPPNLYL